MEREASPPSPSDRERRARLEALQVELRQVKAQLADVPASTRAAVSALEAAVESAKTRRDEARQRVARLEADVAAANAEVSSLQRRVEEAKVLARGRARRDHYVEWLPDESPRRRSNGPDPAVFIGVLPLIGIAGLLVALMVNGCLH